MKVKIGDKVYSGRDEPIMVVLTKKDKWNIAHMAPGANRYCGFPENLDVAEIKKFMATPRR